MGPILTSKSALRYWLGNAPNRQIASSTGKGITAGWI